jgi:protein-disulfide isomerase
MSKNKTLLIIVGVLVLCLISVACIGISFFLIFNANKPAPSPSITPIISSTPKPTLKAEISPLVEEPDEELSNLDAIALEGPYLGNLSTAKYVMIEYADLECPFCKMFYNNTFGYLKDKYITNGSTIFIYKQYPLNSHNPAATDEAKAAYCINELKDYKAYFDFIDKIYATSKGSGQGIDGGKDGILALSRQYGISDSDMNTCLDKESTYLNNALTEVEEIGVTGTPTFVIARLTADGKIDTTHLKSISGNYPKATFDAAFESLK